MKWLKPEEEELSEEHERQIARFRQLDYEKGGRQRGLSFGRFKMWHYLLATEGEAAARKYFEGLGIEQEKP